MAVFIDWLRSLFDAKRYPWFGDDFIHPNNLKKPVNSPARVDLGGERPFVTRAAEHDFSRDQVTKSRDQVTLRVGRR